MQPSSAIEVEISNIFHWIELDWIGSLFVDTALLPSVIFLYFFFDKEFRISL